MASFYIREAPPEQTSPSQPHSPTRSSPSRIVSPNATMGKKRRGPSLEELLDRPWCYYCERDFDDLKILISHQKAKHFKCDNCNRRLNTAGGLSVHLSQVHKEQLTQVQNALPNRMGLDVEIFGMEGIPADIIKSHQQRVASQFQQAELDRQQATGNPPSGVSSNGGQPAKKPKLEPISDLKKRLAEHKAKRAEALAGGSSGDVTPSSAVQSTPTAGGYQSPQIATAPVQQFSYPQPYGGPPAAVASPYPQTGSPVYQNYSPAAGASPYTQSMYPQSYSTVNPPQFPAGLPAGLPAPLPVAYGAPSFPQQLPPSENRYTGLPAASNLPQRPAFAAPPVNALQMQQMHHGHIPPTPAAPGYSNGDSAQPTENVSTPVDNQISGAVKDTATKTEGTSKPKKEKAKAAIRLVYNDDTFSPEERMAQLPRYAFVPDKSAQTALADVPGNAIVGGIQDSDTVIDPAH
ncbi:Zinc finger BED-type predicted [Penicillium paradoxum]|uniref:Zinc finger BED-type predicted n=1 Tax=Penicillium paradoxum TaxID=176176 RepID=UPI002548A6C8|nr:Zinc finger BED-type predicted [Penicillium paradoxum]KAJ5788505.1 Zinc finger BED-type predicted [Penicillium paradoxum]